MSSNLKKNILYQTTYQVLAILLPLVISPYVSRVLGAENLGKYTYSVSIAEYFVLFAMLGINNYGNRVIATNRDDKSKLDESFSSIFILHFGVATFFAIVYFVYAFIFSNSSTLSIIQGLYVLSSIIDVNWFYFGIEKFKQTVARNALIKIITVVSVFIFVNDVNDIYIYTLIMTVSPLLGNILMFFYLPKYTKLVKTNWRDIIKHMKPLLILFVPVVAISLYKIMDRIMLGIIVPKVQLGYYSNSEKAINIPISVIGAFGTVMLPRMSNMLKDGINSESRKYVDSSIKYIMMIALPLAFGLAAVSSCFATVFWGNEFVYCGRLIKCLSSSIPFLALANIIRTQLLIPLKKDRQYTVSVFLGAAVNVVVNLMLIPKYYALGAAIGTVLAETTVCVTQAVYIMKEFNVLGSIKKCFSSVVFSLVMYICISLIASKMKYNVITLIVQILIGAIVYSFLCIIYLWRTKDQMFDVIISAMKRLLLFRKRNVC